MLSTVTLPIWLVAIVGAFALWALFDHVLVPAMHWLMRRRLNRVIDDLNTRLKNDSIRYLFLNIRGITTGLQNGRHAWLAGRNLLLLQEMVRQSKVVDRDSVSLLVELR